MTSTVASPRRQLRRSPEASTAVPSSTVITAQQPTGRPPRSLAGGTLMPRSGSPASLLAAARLQSRNRRVELYRELVKPLALHYARRSQESREDLLQVGLLGLIRAAELYRAETGTPFEAFARPHIRGAILHYLRDEAPSVRLPRRQAELQERLQRLEALADGSRSPISARRLCGQLGIDEEHWSLLLQQRRLNRPLPLEGHLVEELATEPLESPQGQSPSIDVNGLLAQLEARQQRVVRCVVLEGWSYRRLASQMQVSPMTVQRLLHRGLERLRQQLEDRRISSGPRRYRAGSALPAC